MAELFGGIPLDRVSTSMTINATAIILLALYVAVAKRQGVEPRKLAGTVQNDILKEYAARGTYIFPPRPSLRIAIDMFAYCDAELPGWHPISISGYHIREAGSTAAQEVAFTFAHAIVYVGAAIDAGLNVDSFGRRLVVLLQRPQQLPRGDREVPRGAAAVGPDHARALRSDRAARAAVALPRPDGGQRTLTAQQPDNNIVRVALQALAAVLGGTQSLHCNSRDEALGLPTEEAARLALRTQQIIAAETGVAQTVDPVGGAWAIEQLTDRVEREAAAPALTASTSWGAG